MMSPCIMVSVIGISHKEKTKQRPLALNTVELMRVASSKLGSYPIHIHQILNRKIV